VLPRHNVKTVPARPIDGRALGPFTTTQYRPMAMGRAVREEPGMYNAPVTKPIGPFYAWMERLDRWGYITVGFSLLAISMGIFGHG